MSEAFELMKILIDRCQMTENGYPPSGRHLDRISEVVAASNSVYNMIDLSDQQVIWIMSCRGRISLFEASYPNFSFYKNTYFDLASYATREAAERFSKGFQHDAQN